MTLPSINIRRQNQTVVFYIYFCRELSLDSKQSHFHPWLTEIPAPDGGPGSDITNEGLKLQTIDGQ